MGIVMASNPGEGNSLSHCFRIWQGRLEAIADEQLSPGIQRRVAPEDIVQSAFRTIWRRQEAGTIELENRGRAWALLKKITRLKAIRIARHHRARCRDERRDTADDHLPSKEKSVDVQIELQQMMEKLKASVPSVVGRILELRLEGHSVAFIAKELGIARQTVYRGIQLLHDRYERLFGC